MLFPAYQGYARTCSEGNIHNRPTVTDEKLLGFSIRPRRRMSESIRYIGHQRRHPPLIICRMGISESNILQLAESYVMAMMKANHRRGARRETNAAHGQRRENIRLEL